MTKTIRYLALTTILLWFLYAVFTLFSVDMAYNVLSPLTGLSSGLLIMSGLDRYERYKKTAIFFMAGIFTWVIADILLFVYTYILEDDPFLTGLSDELYLAPNYLFGIGLTLFLIADFKKRDAIRLLIDAFIIAVAAFVLVRKLYSFGFGMKETEFTFSYASILYLAAIMYVITLMFLILTIRGLFNHTRAVYMIFLSLGVYNIFEMRYTYLLAGGIDPENIYIDILYMACVCVMGIAFADPSLVKEMDRSAQNTSDGEKSKISKYNWIFGVALIPVVIVLFFAGVINQTDMFILLFAAMGYLIMWKTQQANELSQELLEQQKKENEKLGQWVDYQKQEIKAANEQIEKASYKDALTGLFNRKYSRIFLNQLLMENGPDTKFAVYSMDLNHFKSINDNYGLETGDKVLAEIAFRLKKFANNKIAVFRQGNDEFLVVYNSYANEDALKLLADDMKDELDRPIEINGGILRPAISIGVASYPMNADDIERVLKYADTARHSIKHRHSKTEAKFYDSELIKQMSRQRKIEVKLQSSVYDRDFKLYYQPQVDSKTEELIGMEALIRWIDPEEGFISPGEFIPLAEEMGLMDSLGEWVMRTAARQIKVWNEKYGLDLVVGVNVSPLQLRNPDFAGKLLRVQKDVQIPSKWMDLEITEGYALNSSLSNGDIIPALKREGFTFSVDDFGTGYASFANMLDFTFDRIKIAKELVDHVEDNKNAYVVIKVIIMMAQGLNLSTIAKGVETAKQLKILRELECAQIQGYYFGKPLPAAEFEEDWLSHIKFTNKGK